MSRRLTLPDPSEVAALPGPTPSGFTEPRVPFSGPNGRLTDDAAFTYDAGAGILNTPDIICSGITADLIATGGSILVYQGIGTEGYGVPAIVDDVALSGQSAAIGSTDFTNAGTAGSYRLGYYLVCTTADGAAGTIRLDVTFNDGTAARTLTGQAIALTATNRTTKFTNAESDGSLIKLGSGSIAYSTTLVGIAGTSQYALYVTLERLS